MPREFWLLSTRACCRKIGRDSKHVAAEQAAGNDAASSSSPFASFATAEHRLFMTFSAYKEETRNEVPRSLRIECHRYLDGTLREELDLAPAQRQA